MVDFFLMNCYGLVHLTDYEIIIWHGIHNFKFFFPLFFLKIKFNYLLSSSLSMDLVSVELSRDQGNTSRHLTITLRPSPTSHRSLYWNGSVCEWIWWEPVNNLELWLQSANGVLHCVAIYDYCSVPVWIDGILRNMLLWMASISELMRLH